MTTPEINNQAIQASPEQVGSIGPGVVWGRGPYANAYHGFSELNRPEGNNLVLHVQFIPEDMRVSTAPSDSDEKEKQGE